VLLAELHHAMQRSPVQQRELDLRTGIGSSNSCVARTCASGRSTRCSMMSVYKQWR
jgi:hypothetical protein